MKVKVTYIVVLILIVGAGLFFRLDNFDLSMTHDEVAMANFGESVLKYGIPVRPVERFSPLTTYEFLPYPLALAIFVFGKVDWALRVPALFFGVSTNILLFFIAARLWNFKVGIWAALLFSLSPLSIICGGYAFHPQQTQFIALVTSYIFYLAIRDPIKIHPKFIYAAALGFIATYLSWEGSGFMLIAYFICLLERRRMDFGWLADKHLWLAVIGAGLLVVAQLSNRILWKKPYVAVGREFGSFALLFLDHLYEPFYYIENFFLIGSHTFISLAALIGIVIGFRSFRVRYYGILLIILFILITNFLPTVASRYLYFTQPFLILLAAYAIYSVQLAIGNLKGEYYAIGRVAQFCALLLFPLCVAFSINTNAVNGYKEGLLPGWSYDMIKYPDYKISAKFKSEISEEDVVISAMPHTFEYYTGRKSDYFLQANTIAVVILDPLALPYYKDKYVMSNVLRNLEELQDVLYTNDRVWFFGISSFLFEARNQEEIFSYIKKYCKNVAKTHNGDVYLWDRGLMPEMIMNSI